MRARSVLYGCVGFLALCLAYHQGARTALAENQTLVGITGGDYKFAIDTSGSIFTSIGYGPWQYAGQAPAGLPVGILEQARGTFLLAMANGDTYSMAQTGSTPPFEVTSLGNVFDSTVSTKAMAWPQVKGRYR